jgi:hypothetical protein
LTGLGDPLATAYRLFNETKGALTEPQWFAWIAGYSYNWVCSSGLSACYFGFDTGSSPTGFGSTRRSVQQRLPT